MPGTNSWPTQSEGSQKVGRPKYVFTSTNNHQEGMSDKELFEKVTFELRPKGNEGMRARDRSFIAKRRVRKLENIGSERS